MALGPNELAAMAGQYVGPIANVALMVVEFLAILTVIAWAYILWKFDTKVLISEIGKNKKVINSLTRAKEIYDKKAKVPKLKLFGKLGLGGHVIELPPSECITPFKSRITNKMYHYIKKDGLYWPVQNLVLGHRHEVKDEESGEIKEIYSVEGSGLEVNRDYDAEEAIQNNLINAAIKYRNKDQRNQIYLSYGLMIVAIIVAGLMMLYSIKQFGAMADAISQLREPLKEGIQGAIMDKIGPG